MKKRLFAGLVATALLGAVYTIPAGAGCIDNGNCTFKAKSLKKHTVNKAVAKTKTARSKSLSANKRKAALKAKPRNPVRLRRAPAAGGGNVAALIRSMAPAHGVPAWFALRIADVESNYNPHLRGAAGEYGVFQLKCATARGIGFSGNCSALLDPRINVQYGLKHLSLAMKSSRGNLRLAASKHNGGLGRKTIVQGYVAKVF